MSSGLQAICPKETPCKCCGTPATLYGLVDFHKNCEVPRANPLEISGIPVYYHRCPNCRFIFTIALDHFTKADFEHYVYNNEYPLIDPEYQDARPRMNAALMSRLFAQAKPARILDYGGGNGKLASLLRESGFPQVETYDPFVPRFALKPPAPFDCVICFEVLEHATDPSGTLGDMVEFLTDTGLIVLSTLLQPADIDRRGLSWWYAAPRNAHISLYTKVSLERLLEPRGFQIHSLGESYHVLYRQNVSLGLAQDLGDD